jgi:hypothetical protein
VGKQELDAPLGAEDLADFESAIDAGIRLVERETLRHLAEFDKLRPDIEEACRGLYPADKLDLEKLKAFNDVGHKLAHAMTNMGKAMLQLELARTGKEPEPEPNDIPDVIRRLFQLGDD